MAQTSKPWPPATITVYRDHPEWDKREKWWMMPSPFLNELFVAKYEMGHDECPSPSDIAFV